MRFLVQMNARLDCFDRRHMTPLMHAVERNQKNVTKYLLSVVGDQYDLLDLDSRCAEELATDSRMKRIFEVSAEGGQQRIRDQGPAT
jgi:ankyrin repeat protein